MSTLTEKWLQKDFNKKYQPPSTFVGLLWKRNFGFINRKLMNGFLEVAEFLILSLICDQKYLEQIIGLTFLQIIFGLMRDSFLTINRRLVFHNQIIRIKSPIKVIALMSIVSALPLMLYQGGNIITVMILYRLMIFVIQSLTFIQTFETQSTKRVYISPLKIFLPKIIALILAFPFLLRAENHLLTLVAVLFILLIGKFKSEYNFYQTMKDSMKDGKNRSSPSDGNLKNQDLMNELLSYVLPYFEIFVIYLSISYNYKINWWGFLLLIFLYRAVNRPLKSLQLDLNFFKMKKNDLAVEITLEKILKFQWLSSFFIGVIISLTKYQNKLNYITISLCGFFIFQDLLIHRLRIRNEARFIIAIKIFYLTFISLAFFKFEIMITPAQLFGFYFILAVYLLTYIMNRKISSGISTEPIYLAEIEKKKKLVLKKDQAINKIKIINNSSVLIKSNIDEHELVHQLWKTYPLNLLNSDLKKIEVPPEMTNKQLADYFQIINGIIDNSLVHIFRSNQLIISTKKPSYFETTNMGSLFTKCFKNTTYLGSKALFKHEKSYYFFILDKSTFIVVEKKQFNEKDLRLLDQEKMKFIGYSLL